MASIRNKVLLPLCNVHSVQLATNSLVKQQHVLNVQSTNTKIKIHNDLSRAKDAKLPNTKTNWAKAAAKTTSVRAQMDDLKLPALTVSLTIQKYVLDVPPVKCCSQTKAASNAVREKHLLVLQLLAWTTFWKFHASVPYVLKLQYGGKKQD
jgi:hypothetical protein